MFPQPRRRARSRAGATRSRRRCASGRVGRMAGAGDRRGGRRDQHGAAASSTSPASPGRAGPGSRVAAGRRGRAGLRLRRLPGDPARRRSIEVGGFPEEFFLYHEDVDLSLRVRLAGGRLGVAAGARVDHDYEFEKGPEKWRCLERNRWATLIRTYPAALLFVLMPGAAGHRAGADPDLDRRRLVRAEAPRLAPIWSAGCRGCCASGGRSRRGARSARASSRRALRPELGLAVSRRRRALRLLAGAARRVLARCAARPPRPGADPFGRRAVRRCARPGARRRGGRPPARGSWSRSESREVATEKCSSSRKATAEGGEEEAVGGHLDVRAGRCPRRAGRSRSPAPAGRRRRSSRAARSARPGGGGGPARARARKIRPVTTTATDLEAAVQAVRRQREQGGARHGPPASPWRRWRRRRGRPARPRACRRDPRRASAGGGRARRRAPAAPSPCSRRCAGSRSSCARTRARSSAPAPRGSRGRWACSIRIASTSG